MKKKVNKMKEKKKKGSSILADRLKSKLSLKYQLIITINYVDIPSKTHFTKSNTSIVKSNKYFLCFSVQSFVSLFEKKHKFP